MTGIASRRGGATTTRPVAVGSQAPRFCLAVATSVWLFVLLLCTGMATGVGAITAGPGSQASASTATTATTTAAAAAAREEPATTAATAKAFRDMHARILGRRASNSGAFLAALDQSGGSTPRALEAYGMGPSVGNYEIGTESMFNAVHAMRTRIMTSDCFDGDKILGAILFENTMDRTVEGVPTCQYLWETKGILPFLKIDKGLRTLHATDTPDGIEIEEGTSSVQLLAPIPDLEALLRRAKAKGVYGTKARSVISNPRNPEHIDALVKQQFQLARRVLREGLVPIIEPEVDVTQDPSDKAACEEVLCRALLRELDDLKNERELVVEDEQTDSPSLLGRSADARTILGEDHHKVMIKISLPERPDRYKDCVDHPCCLGVVALSGGYDQAEANDRLSKSRGIIASFSRALAEGLSHGMSEDDFEACLAESIDKIYAASALPSSSP